MSRISLNTALCRALGVDPANVTALTLRLRATAPPTLTVVSRVRDGNAVVERLTSLKLTASPEPMQPPAAEAGMAAGQGASRAPCSSEAGGGEISGADVLRTDPLGNLSRAGNPGGGGTPDVAGGAA